jgi:hypothetical protein
MTTGQTGQLQYWKPGSEERQLRVFISHRWGDDEALYAGAIDALNRQGFSVQDLSLTKNQRRQGPRGGQLPKLEVQADIAARIYSSDVVIAPSRVATSWSQWLTWEIQTATIGYGVPILFVKEQGHQRQAKLVTEVEKLGLPHRVCDPEKHLIARNVAELVSTRPTWAVRLAETDPHLRFRGPVQRALDAVMKQTPYHPRLQNYEPPAEVKRRGLFDGWFGRGR